MKNNAIIILYVAFFDNSLHYYVSVYHIRLFSEVTQVDF